MDRKSTECLRPACLCTRTGRAPVVSCMRAAGAQAMAQATQCKPHASALRGPAHGRPDKHPARDTPSGTQLVTWCSCMLDRTSSLAHSPAMHGLRCRNTATLQFMGRTWQMATAPSDVRACVSGALGWKEAAPQARGPLQAACNPAHAGLAKCTGPFVLCSIYSGF